jgi:hypothetical protein
VADDRPDTAGGGAEPRGGKAPFGSLDENLDNRLERREQRIEEDRSFVPVIVKRIDQHRRHVDDVLVSAIGEGLEQLHRPAVSLGLSSVAAGLMLGFTALSRWPTGRWSAGS